MKNEPITKSQLADLLGLSLRTLQRKLLRAELIIPRGLISPDSQIQILLKLGYSVLAHQLQKKAGRKTGQALPGAVIKVPGKMIRDNRKRWANL